MANHPISSATGTLGATIKALRKQARMSQAELAFRSGFRRVSITNIEAGRQRVNEDSLRHIAAALGYTVHITFRKKANTDVPVEPRVEL